MNYLVLYNKDYIKDRLEQLVSGRLSKYAKFTFQKYDRSVSFNIKWLRENFDIQNYDGFCIVKDGEWLDGKFGVHHTLFDNGRRISLIEVESFEKKYRKWSLGIGGWKLKLSNKGEYRQLEYTFEHEVGHSLTFLHKILDTLHLFIKAKLYEKWWDTQKFPELFLKSGTFVDKLYPLVERKWKALEAIMEELGDPIKMICSVRSCEDQNKEYEKGTSKAKCGESMHQYGIAIDYCFKNGVAFPPSQDKRWLTVNKLAQTIGFYSYGISEGWDDGHIEVILNYSEKDFVNGKVDYSKLS